MSPLGNVSVFCGSRLGDRTSFASAATHLGAALAQRDIGLVYGGASIGLMGVVANAVLNGGGRVTGVITESLADHEIAHPGLGRLDIVPTMHERKARMSELSDAVIMLPGGVGTYEEFLEAVTWVHLGIHAKPCGILNVDGFYDHLLTFLSHAVERGFIGSTLIGDIVVGDDPDALLASMVEASASDHSG
jgi:uncharacterized protein (TIGR00730 family)